MVAQVFQQLLPILPLFVAQVVFAKHQVKRLLFEVADGRACAHAILDAGNPQLAEHIVQSAAHMLVGVD